MATRRQTRTFELDPGGPQGAGRERVLALATRLHDLVSEHPDFEVLHGPAPGLYRFRYVPNVLAERQEEPGVHIILDRLNLETVEAARRGGRDLVRATRHGGRAAVSVSIRPEEMTEDDVDAAFEAVARWGRLLSKTHPVCYVRPPETEAL